MFAGCSQPGRIVIMRIGAVSYLNTKPLVYRLAESAPHVDLVFDLPSRLADRLARGTLDVALIPSVEFFQNPAYSIVSDACIGCRGPVLSVKLLCRKPARQIQTLALDEGSRTSAALTRILLEQRFGIRPRLVPLPIDSDWTTTAADAVLLIGDRAIHAANDSLAAVWDLGDEWCRWAELPFVFAMWVARPGIDTTGLDEVLQSARDQGLAHLDEIAAAEAPAVGLSPELVLSYLRDNLYFFLGPRERRGLQLYYQHAVRMGLAPAGLPLDATSVSGYAP
jgi:chorismate dehydratase